MSNLIYNDIYCRKVLPYLKSEYFENNNERIVFDLIDNFINKYNSLPSKEALFIDLSNSEKVGEELFEECKGVIGELEIDATTDIDWLFDQTEKLAQDRAVYLALLKSLEICDGKEKELDKAAIPQILTEAIGVTFDSHIGNDFFDDAEGRYEFYHQVENKIPFNIDILNVITKGGVSKETLTILMAGPGVGKSFVMCHFAAHNLMQGKNVLYITLEMSEERIHQRIEENLLDLDEDGLLLLPKHTYLKKIENLRQKTVGKLKVKQYPTKQAGSANFRALVRDMKIKKNFVPDVIYIDYLNICIASTLRMARMASLYEYVKTIGEEIRGLAVELGIPIITATQFNREGYRSSDPGMDDVSESFGTSMTADWIWALVSSEELELANQLQFVQIKNRYGDLNLFKRFLVGINRAKMQLFNLGSDRQAEQAIPKEEKELFKEIEKKLNKNVFDDFT